MHQDGCLGEGSFEGLKCLGVVRAQVNGVSLCVM